MFPTASVHHGTVCLGQESRKIGRYNIGRDRIFYFDIKPTDRATIFAGDLK